MTSGAAANAAGQVGMTNAITGGLGTYLNYTNNNALLNALRGGGSGYGGYTAPQTSFTGADYSLGGKL
jgi:hypothetical protein